MKFGQLIHKKIITIVATRCQILRIKCIKIDLCWSFAPDPYWVGGLQHFSRPSSWNKGDILPKEGEVCREGEKGKEGSEGKEEEKRGDLLYQSNPCLLLYLYWLHCIFMRLPTICGRGIMF